MAEKLPQFLLKARRRLAQNARAARESLGWTQEQAAEKINCSVQALQRLERASIRVTVDFAAEVAKAYGIDLVQLFVPTGPWRAPRAGRPVGKRKPSKPKRRT